MACAERIARQPRRAVVAAKRAMVEGLQLSLDEGLALEGGLFIECQTDAATLALQQQAADRYRDAADDEHITLG